VYWNVKLKAILSPPELDSWAYHLLHLAVDRFCPCFLFHSLPAEHLESGPLAHGRVDIPRYGYGILHRDAIRWTGSSSCVSDPDMKSFLIWYPCWLLPHQDLSGWQRNEFKDTVVARSQLSTDRPLLTPIIAPVMFGSTMRGRFPACHRTCGSAAKGKRALQILEGKAQCPVAPCFGCCSEHWSKATKRKQPVF
jgi:hypothetical protein